MLFHYYYKLYTFDYLCIEEKCCTGVFRNVNTRWQQCTVCPSML